MGMAEASGDQPMTIYLKKRGTILEAKHAGINRFQIRYIAPIRSDWISETYEASVLAMAGWTQTTRKDGDE